MYKIVDSKYNGLKIYFFVCCKKAKYDKYKNEDIFKSIKYYNHMQLKNDPPPLNDFILRKFLIVTTSAMNSIGKDLHNTLNLLISTQTIPPLHP